MIDEYIGELDRRLGGSRRVKADLLAEARDALLDAANAYERGGLAPQAAAARAVDDFGTVDEIGPEYQAELAFSQGRFTGLALFFTLIVQAAAWQIAWPAVRPGPADGWLAFGLVGGVGLAWRLAKSSAGWRLLLRALIAPVMSFIACFVAVTAMSLVFLPHQPLTETLTTDAPGRAIWLALLVAVASYTCEAVWIVMRWIRRQRTGKTP